MNKEINMYCESHLAQLSESPSSLRKGEPGPGARTRGALYIYIYIYIRARARVRSCVSAMLCNALSSLHMRLYKA